MKGAFTGDYIGYFQGTDLSGYLKDDFYINFKDASKGVFILDNVGDLK